MLPSTWRNKDAALAMLREARTTSTPWMIGHLCTTWVGTDGFCRALLGARSVEKAAPKTDAKAKIKRQRSPGDIVAALNACMGELKQPAPKNQTEVVAGAGLTRSFNCAAGPVRRPPAV
jgi:hypothetical protein